MIGKKACCGIVLSCCSVVQVFWTVEGKGWGLRTLEDLPAGAFVCEYAGEILTNLEMDERNCSSTANTKHHFPLQLDADWSSERFLKDEEALCLDGTYFGNVARFINHRCAQDSHVVANLCWG
jgi:SET domain-containing protein